MQVQAVYLRSTENTVLGAERQARQVHYQASYQLNLWEPLGDSITGVIRNVMLGEICQPETDKDHVMISLIRGI